MSEFLSLDRSEAARIQTWLDASNADAADLRLMARLFLFMNPQGPLAFEYVQDGVVVGYGSALRKVSPPRPVG